MCMYACSMLGGANAAKCSLVNLGDKWGFIILFLGLFCWLGLFF